MFERNMNTPQDVGVIHDTRPCLVLVRAGCGQKTYRSSDEQGTVDSPLVAVEITIRLRAA